MQGFHPQKNKTHVKSYANGGIVKGPGTGTSDDVSAMVPTDGYIMPADSTQALGFKPGMRPAQVSNGEAVLTPEQVQAAGGFQALDAMKNATHTPVPEQGVESPRFFFANGGATDEERSKWLAQIPNSAPAGWTGGQGERVTGNDFTRNVSNTLNALGPIGGSAAPIAAGFARFGAGAAGAASASPFVEKALAYSAPAAGFGALASASRQEQASVAAPPRAPQAAALAPTAAPAGQPALPGTPSAQDNAQAPAPAAGNVNVRRQPNGVMEFSGQNVAGDVSYSGTSGFKPSGSGVSAQNMGAADQLAARSAQQRAQPEQPAQQQAQGFIPQDTGGFGLLDKNRIALRNAMIDAKQGDLGAGAVVNSLLQQQAAAPGQQIERDRMAAEVAAGDANRALKSEEQGAERGFRSGQLANDIARIGLEGQRVGSEVQARGFEINQAKRLETLRAQYEAATDPKAKAEMAQKLRTLAGKDDQANKFTVVPGGQEFDATAGVMRNVPARVLNNQTGQFVDGTGGKLPPLKENSSAMAVVNDASLSKEQRAAKLRDLGYN